MRNKGIILYKRKNTGGIHVYGEILKKLRLRKNLTQKSVAEKIGVKNNTLSSYESGKRQPDFDTLSKLAELYDVSTDYILGREKKQIEMPSGMYFTSDKAYKEALSDKDKKDIAKELEGILEGLDSEQGFAAFDGEPLDDATKMVLRDSLERSMLIARQIAKQKFTPNKHKK